MTPSGYLPIPNWTISESQKIEAADSVPDEKDAQKKRIEGLMDPNSDGNILACVTYCVTIVPGFVNSENIRHGYEIYTKFFDYSTY